MINAGDAYRAHKDYVERQKHWYVVISDPTANPRRVITVNFTGWEQGKDDTCIVERHQWSELTKRSCISYVDTTGTTVSAIENAKKAGLIESLSPISPELLREIREGTFFSDFVATEIKGLLIAQGLYDATFIEENPLDEGD